VPSPYHVLHPGCTHTLRCAALLAGVALVLAIAVPNIEYIFGLCGATVSVLISFILPAAIYLRVTAMQRSGPGSPASGAGGRPGAAGFLASLFELCWVQCLGQLTVQLGVLLGIFLESLCIALGWAWGAWAEPVGCFVAGDERPARPCLGRQQTASRMSTQGCQPAP
jgi:hypothetical protein